MDEHRLQGVYVDKRRMQTHDIKREIGGLERRPVVNIKAVDETSVLSSRCKVWTGQAFRADQLLVNSELFRKARSQSAIDDCQSCFGRVVMNEEQAVKRRCWRYIKVESKISCRTKKKQEKA
jgi:hypothetical protein